MLPMLEPTRQTYEDVERLLRLGSDALALSSGAYALDSYGIPEDHPARRSALAAEHLAVGIADAVLARSKTLVRDGGGPGSKSVLEAKDGLNRVNTENDVAHAAEADPNADSNGESKENAGRDANEGEKAANGNASEATKGTAASDSVEAGDEAVVAKSDSAGAEKPAHRSANIVRAPEEVLSEFYEQLRDLKSLHKNEGDGTRIGVAADVALVSAIPMPPGFSGEEGGGRYLDLQTHYSAYVNMLLPRPNKREKGKNKGAAGGGGGGRGEKRSRSEIESTTGAPPPKTPRIEYLEYLKKVVVDHGSVPAGVRSSRQYEQYLATLVEYLVSFADRLHPLSEVRRLVSAAEKSLRGDLRGRLASVLERFPDAAAALEGMGADGVREELLMLGLKCGGRPEDRAARLLEAAKAVSTGKDGGGKLDPFGRRVVLEGLVVFVLEEMLTEELRRTVLNVEKKQSLSWVELEAERVAEEAVAERDEMNEGDEEDGEDEEKPLYNPKDVPLGWDGKPIPFWLYKLHGLNHEFQCEICGNTKYKGPRAFERHFTDPQHVHGLRCLDISYSKDYFMVTRIADAVKLRDNIRQKSKLATFDADAEEEFEDKEGNVSILIPLCLVQVRMPCFMQTSC